MNDPNSEGSNGGNGAGSADGKAWTAGDVDVMRRVHQRLVQEMDVQAISRLEPDRARRAVEEAVRTIVTDVAPHLYGEDRERIVTGVVDDAVGLGPLEPLLADPTISEVMVNAPDEIYFERDGVIYLSDVRFRDKEHIVHVVDRIVSPLGRRLDESSPYVDARLQDGSRVNAVIPPLIPKSPTVTIRKFRRDKYTITDLIGNGTLPAHVAEFLEACVRLRLNVVISGGTGTGKTTFLNALSAFIPSTERIITIEDPIELKLQQPHVISMEARPPNIEGKNQVTQRDLVRNSLRMRPDRIIIGEVRSGEAFDMLQAMNTGHEGSLTTVHANSCRDALARIENMVLMAGMDLPVRSIREQTASALHLVIQLARFSDGQRRITLVSEITAMEAEVVTMQDLFRYEQTGMGDNGRVLGLLEPTGIRPTFIDRFGRSGIAFDAAAVGGGWG